ncbi:MAG: hypothetical protein V1859_10295 [archaeon]
MKNYWTPKQANFIGIALFIAFAILFSSCGKETAKTTEQPIQVKTAIANEQVQPSCPKGLVNDPYPGRCNLYIDQNSDNICDLSEI